MLLKHCEPLVVNAKTSPCSTTTLMGARTNMILATSVMHHREERCAQRHEYCASKKLFQECKSKNQVLSGISTDAGSQSVKSFKEVFGEKPCSLDSWHALKNDVRRNFKCIGTGARKNEGLTWHKSLYDKV